VDDSLQRLVADGVIDEVHARLMSGKEASVFIVERKGELVAAKVYKAREQRTFKATASYTEGRNQTRNTRDKRAMRKGTTYGKELIEKSWRDMEFEALSDAFHAGVRVPEPIMLYEDVLLMQLLVDEEGRPAPRLADFELTPEVASLLHEEIYGQVRLLLSCGRIHGDLSAFNVLIAQDGPTIIDMPQVVDAAGNNSAAEILRRDLANVTEHLAKYDARLLRFRDCGLPLFDAWQRGHIDAAMTPQEGNIRSDTHHRSRRVRDAERGRMGRAGGRVGGPERVANGAPGNNGTPAAGAPAERPRHDGPPREHRPAAPRGDQRGQQLPQRQEQGRMRGDGPAPSRPMRPDPFPPQRRQDPRQDGGPPPPRQEPRQDRGPPPPGQDRPRQDRGPPPRQDRGPPPPRQDRGPPPPRQDRGPPPPRQDGGPPPPRQDRGPPPPRQDRGPSSRPRRPAPEIERVAPRAPRRDDDT
jgi:RIO kinase 1